jgi:hypothetical protein
VLIRNYIALVTQRIADIEEVKAAKRRAEEESNTNIMNRMKGSTRKNSRNTLDNSSLGGRLPKLGSPSGSGGGSPYGSPASGFGSPMSGKYSPEGAGSLFDGLPSIDEKPHSFKARRRQRQLVTERRSFEEKISAPAAMPAEYAPLEAADMDAVLQASARVPSLRSSYSDKAMEKMNLFGGGSGKLTGKLDSIAGSGKLNRGNSVSSRSFDGQSIRPV